MCNLIVVNWQRSITSVILDNSLKYAITFKIQCKLKDIKSRIFNENKCNLNIAKCWLITFFNTKEIQINIHTENISFNIKTKV